VRGCGRRGISCRRPSRGFVLNHRAPRTCNELLRGNAAKGASDASVWPRCLARTSEDARYPIMKEPTALGSTSLNSAPTLDVTHGAQPYWFCPVAQAPPKRASSSMRRSTPIWHHAARCRSVCSCAREGSTEADLLPLPPMIPEIWAVIEGSFRYQRIVAYKWLSIVPSTIYGIR
jgi:hypothetical protein